MKFLSLFTGIGGFDLGLEWAGHQCIGQVEYEFHLLDLLKEHWPHVPKMDDVRDVYGTEFGDFDLLVAGYPCQPFSHAGKKKGSHDERHLWPEVARIIGNVRPAYVLLENVRGHLRLGFGEVLGDLASLGYDAEWDCIPAKAVGAPHERDRVFVVAYPNSQPQHVLHGSGGEEGGGAPAPEGADDTLESYRRTRGERQWGSEPRVGRVVDGLPTQVDRRLIALGNAVVPHVAEYIGLRLAAIEQGVGNQ